MKRIITISLLVVSIFLVSCSANITNLFNEAEPWCKDDFMLYSKEGEIIEQLTADNDYEIDVWKPGRGTTYRGVAVDDDAIEALKKYDLCYGKAVYVFDDTDIPETLTSDTDIENLIITSEEEIIFLFAFDEEYNPLDCLPFIESDSIPNYAFGFVVEDGKISEIHMIGKSQ